MEISKTKVDRWLPHIAGLLLFSILPLFVFDRNNDRAIYWMYSYYYQLTFMIVAFYFNYLVIVPRFFFSKKRIYFIIALFLFAILLLAISKYLYELLPFEHLGPGNRLEENARQKNFFGIHPKLVENFFLLLVVLGFSSGMAIISQLRKNETKQKAIEKARVDSELAFLKNQISPHFFFNALNSIYALIAIDGEKAQKAVEKLSVLMRYLIYESDVRMVDLHKEFDFTSKYIELMRQRLSPKIKLEVNIDQELPDVKIPPLLFIPFVENAFKHGISYREKSFVSILLKTNDDSVIFETKNSIPTIEEQNNKKGGVGIENIKKRLELIYGNTFELEISNADGEFFVRLMVPLKLKNNE